MTELVTLKFRRGTTEQWNSTTSGILTSGEPGFDTTLGILKIGNGISKWVDLKTFEPAAVLTETSPIAIGYQAGQTGQSSYAVAIGNNAGQT